MYKRPVSAENVRYENPPQGSTPGGFGCPTCGGWVNPLERIYTDEGIYHDRLDCLTEGRFEELVAKYGCRCEAAFPTFTEAEWIEHLDEEHSRPLDVGGMVSGESPEQATRSAHETPPTLVPGQYDSDDLDRIVSKTMRKREQAAWQELAEKGFE